MTSPAAAGKDAAKTARPLTGREERRSTPADADPTALPRTIGTQSFGDAVRAATVNSAPVGGGVPLGSPVRSFMEERFGHDFSEVRVHTGPQATESAGALAAKAYTVGTDITFRAGEYAPDTVDGRRSIAHELAHVVQQSRGGGPAPAFDAGHALEHDAERAADQVLTGGRAVDVVGASSPGLARQEDPNPAAEDQAALRKRLEQAEPPGSPAFKQKVSLVGEIEKLGGNSYDPGLFSTDELIQKYAAIAAARPRYKPGQFDPKAQLAAGIEALGGMSVDPARVSEQELSRRYSEASAARFAKSLEHKPVTYTAKPLSREEAGRNKELESQKRIAAYHEEHPTVRDVAIADAARIQKAVDPSDMGVVKGAAATAYLVYGFDPATARAKAANVESVASLALAYTPGSASEAGHPIETESRLPPESRPAEQVDQPPPPATTPAAASPRSFEAPSTHGGAEPEGPSHLAPALPGVRRVEPVPSEIADGPGPANDNGVPWGGERSSQAAEIAAPEQIAVGEDLSREVVGTTPGTPEPILGSASGASGRVIPLRRSAPGTGTRQAPSTSGRARTTPRNRGEFYNRLLDVMRKNLGQSDAAAVGAANEEARVLTLRMRGVPAENLNDVKRNIAAMDITSADGFGSGKAHGIIDPLPMPSGSVHAAGEMQGYKLSGLPQSTARPWAALMAYENDLVGLIANKPGETRPGKSTQGARSISDAADTIQQSGSWPASVPKDASVKQIENQIRFKSDLVVPSDHAVALRAWLREWVPREPERYGLPPNTSPTQAQVDQIVDRVKSSGVTSVELTRLMRRATAESQPSKP
jgi:hypothetical protein